MPRDLDTDSLLTGAFGALLPTLLDEAPERRAWSRLEPDAVKQAIRVAQTRTKDPAMKMGFRTLLKQQLDAACGLAPAPMEFEASYMTPDERQARPASRAWRDDRDARDAERRAEARKRDLWTQARRLVDERRRGSD